MAEDGLVEMTSSYLVIDTSPEGISSVYQAGKYHDHIVRTDAGWRFKTKRAIYDTTRVQTLLAYPI
jgi:anthranilate 1,2-dioxygenase small subunit